MGQFFQILASISPSFPRHWRNRVINVHGAIPKECIVRGTGNGKVWEFRRRRIEEWLGRR